MEACQNPDILKVIFYVKSILDIVFIIVPIGLILMIGIDFAKNVMANKEDDMKKNLNIAIKRIIYCVCIFFVPTIVTLMNSILDDLGVDYAECLTNAKQETINSITTNQAQAAYEKAKSENTMAAVLEAETAIEKITDEETKKNMKSDLEEIKQGIIDDEKSKQEESKTKNKVNSSSGASSNSGASSGSSSTSSLFLETINTPDTSYKGHTVDLTDAQYEKVLRSIYGEQEEGSYEIYVGLCQYIRDYIDYGTLKRTYDNLGSFWLKRGGDTSKVPSYKNTAWFQENHPEMIKAVDYVFKSGGSLVQRQMCFYVDDDDESLNGSYESAYHQLVVASCNSNHTHEKVSLSPSSNTSNWIEFNFGIK